jgi:hypothetical protein
MKVLSADQQGVRFEMDRKEHILLFHLLEQYPLVPAGHHTLSRQGIHRQEENQRLLEESIQTQRLAHRQQVTALLKEPGRFERSGHGKSFRVGFTRGEVEWLLQICNDIRIGSWLALGSPDLDHQPDLSAEPEKARHYINLEIAGAFEMQFIGAISSDFTPNHDETA